MTENIINNLMDSKSISPSDIRVLDAIKQITLKGDNAEVKQKKDGTLSVYAVKKSKLI